MTLSPILLYPQQGEAYAPPVPLPPSAAWWDYFQTHRDTSMAPQVYDWTCSIASTTWVLQATGLDPFAAREAVAYKIGYPSCVNEQVGLVSTTCVERVFEQYGVEAVQEWVDWPRLVDVASSTTGVLNGLGWYHFVGIRGITEWGGIWIANSAAGYRNVWETLDENQFNALGPFQVVRLVR